MGRKLPVSRHVLVPGPRVAQTVSGKTPIRKLPLPDVMDRLKYGIGSIPFPADVKGLDIRYYRNNCPIGVVHFIAQHAPEIAYANPTLPFNITKLGKPLTKWGLRNTDAFASTPSIGKMRPNLPTSGEESEGGEAAKDVRPVVHLKEDGTELKRGEKVPAEIVVNFHSKAAETISIKGGARWTILKRLLDTIDVKPPQKLLEKLPALQIEAPEGLPAEEVGTTTVEEQPTSSQTITA